MEPSEMFDIDDALRYLIVHEGSDLHLKVPSQPIVRIHGKMVPIEGSEPLKPEDTERVSARSSTTPNKLAEFDTENEVDFSYQIEGLARFRVNAFRQRGYVSLVMRAIPVNIKSVDELLLPPAITQARRGGARHHPAHRHDRLGQVDDARGDDRPHEPDDAQAHRHDRGPDRVPAPGPPSRSSTSARSGRTRRPSSARCAASCARTPTSSSSARCATRRRSRPPCRRPRPATSSSRRCTRSTPSRRSTASSTSSRPTRPARPAR